MPEALDLSPSVLAPTPKALKPAGPPQMRAFGDAKATRQCIYDDTMSAIQNLEPLTDGKLTLKLSNPTWMDPERHTRKRRKEAVLKGETLSRRIRGTWELHDNESGQLLQKRHQVIGAVPYLSSMGTFTHRGNEYTVNHQNRLLPGGFARIKDNGELETYMNVLPGKGVSHRYFIDPEKEVFKMKIGQAEMPLMPLLHALGATDPEIREAWGHDLHATNYKHLDSGGTMRKLADRLLRKSEREGLDEGSLSQGVKAAIERMEVDPEVMQSTLGKPYTHLNKDVILAATKKLLAVSKGEADPDDRDHLAYQKTYGPEDLFSERIARDHSRIRQTAFKKIAAARSLDKMPSGILTPQLEQVLLGSGLAQSLEEINPAEVLDKQSRLTRLGEGGIPSLDAVPDEARNVQPSHMGFVDPLRTPESFRAGVDLQIASGARKGKDGRLYTQFLNQKTGQLEWKSPQDLANHTVATSDVLQDPFWKSVKRVPTMRGGRIEYVPQKGIDYVLPHFESAFSPLGNLVPGKSAVKGQRVSMASRMLTQALSLRNAEAPFVRSAVAGSGGTRSYEEEYGHHMGALAADKAGRVEHVGNGAIKVRHDDGTEVEHELYDNHPFNRKTLIHQTPVVEAGQLVKPGQLLARSNFTDHTGATALGLNTRVGYMPWEGYNYEDAIVVSDSYAKRATSENMYQHGLEVTDRHKLGKKPFVRLFPGKFDRKILDRLDEHGLVRPGAEVHYGEPLILAARERDRSANKVHKKGQAGYHDESVLWRHHDSGIVTDVVRGKNGPVVVVKSASALQVGDKMSGRYGDKGVIAAIVPDHEMPHSEDGNPLEVLLNDNGTISRTNPVQHVEGQLGKIAALTGKPINLQDFENEADMNAWARREMAKHGVKDMEDVTLPKYGTKVNVQTGNRFLMKLHHTSESKTQGRGSGGYSSDDTPSKGGDSGSKRVAMLDTNALMSHGAIETERDVRLIKGNRRERYWLQVMQGLNPADPEVPTTYQKYVTQLQGAGVNVVKKGTQTQIMAMTNAGVRARAGERLIKSGETVRFDKELQPIPGGLFDPKLTGGHGGKQWSAIELPEPLPNPVMEEPIRRVLGLTGKQFEGVISGDHALPGFGTGPAAISKALDSINLDREIAGARTAWQQGRGAKRDEALRRWQYLDDAKKLDMHPRDWVLDRVPVIPPTFRPVSVMGNKGIPLVSDPNYLYKELLTAGDNFRDMTKAVGHEGAGPERLSIYHAFKAITGLGDPVHPKLIEKNVKGLLKSVFGSSPKFGSMQRKLLSSTVDNVARSVVVPNPDFDMDTLGLPEEQAFQIYSKFVVRNLKRRGLPIAEAVKHVKERSKLAKDVLEKEMESRPVYMNRAPVLHKFGIMAFRPQLVTGSAVKVSPLVVKGFNMDFDGDAVQYHVPTTESAVKEAYDRMLPSKSLLSPADFKTPVHAPGQEYLAGLYHATRQGKGGRRVRTFRSKAEALEAYGRGEAGVQDEVNVMNDR